MATAQEVYSAYNSTAGTQHRTFFHEASLPMLARRQRSSKNSFSRSDSWRYCSVAYYIRRITEASLVVEDRALYDPAQNPR